MTNEAKHTPGPWQRRSIELFRENPRFDEARFRRACVPGANVRARGRKAVA